MSSFLQSILPGATEPDVSYNFVVLIGIRPFGDFRSVTGAGLTITPQTVVEGGRNHSPHFLPYGRDQVMKWGEVTLRWGTPVWSTLYDWADAVRVGKFYRRDVFVIQLKRNGWPTRLMRFAGAFPIHWKASPLDTASSEWSLSELTLVYEDFNMILTRTDSLTDLLNTVQSLGEGIGDALESFGDEVWEDMSEGKHPLQSLGEMLYDGLEDLGEGIGEAVEDGWEEQLEVDGGFYDPDEDEALEGELEESPDTRSEAEWDLPFTEDDGAEADADAGADTSPAEEETSPFLSEDDGDDAADDPEDEDDPAEEDASPFDAEDDNAEDADADASTDEEG